MIFPFKEEEGSVLRSADANDLTQKYRVISTLVAIGDLALNIAYCSIEEGDVVLPFVPFYFLKFIDPFSGKTSGKFFLIFAQHIDSKDLGLAKARLALRCLINTNHYQGGIERQRREGIYREAKG